MQLFNIKEVAKFGDENPDQPYSDIAERGYVRHRVISNDRCCVTIVCFRNGQGPDPEILHTHPGADEVYYVVEGEALTTDENGVQRIIGAGNFAYFKAGEFHNTGAAPGKDCRSARTGR